MDTPYINKCGFFVYSKHGIREAGHPFFSSFWETIIILEGINGKLNKINISESALITKELSTLLLLSTSFIAL